MLTELESEILLTAMDFVKMEGKYLLEESSSIMKKDNQVLSWFDIYSKNSLINESLYESWVLQNQESILLNSLSDKINLEFLSRANFDSFFKSKEKAWSIFFTITRPGISSDEKNAILQVTASCPSGPPNYASLIFLEKSIHFWHVKSTHGLFSQ